LDAVHFEHGDELEEGAFGGGVVGDPSELNGWDREAGAGAFGQEKRQEFGRLVAQVAAVAAPEDEQGRGGRRIHRAEFYGAAAVGRAGAWALALARTAVLRVDFR